MTREEIRQKQIDEATSTSITETLLSTPNYEFSPRATDLLECAFTKGAEWADSHPASPWHKVASVDLPKEQKGDATILPFLVKAKDGAVYMAYYAWYEEEDTPTFYDDCDCPLDVEYWMEVPEPPK